MSLVRWLPRIAPLVLVAGLWGCPDEAPVCGDGVIGPGETEDSCCIDTGCAFGACDADSRRCREPWWDSCAGSSECTEGGPYLCRDQAAPAYDCDACGCPADGRCVGGACFLVSDLAGERERDEIPFDRPLDDYFALLDELARAPLTLATLGERLIERTRADRRAAAVVVGGFGPTADEAAVAAQLAADFATAGFAVEEHALTTVVDCTTAAAFATEQTADVGVDVALVPADAAHREVCARQAAFPACRLPTVSDCVLAAGREPLTVIAIDQDALLERVDRALLLRGTNVPPGQVLVVLDTLIGRWRETVDTLPVPETHEVELPSGTRVVRGMLAREDPPLWWVSLVSRERRAYGMLGYRLLWNDAAIQLYLLDNDLTGRDCSWSVDGPILNYVCESGAARVDVVIDTSDFTITSVTTAA